MPPRLDAIGIVSTDLHAAARFYRLLGVDVPEPDGPHLSVTLPNGLRLMWDTEELVRQIEDEWMEPVGNRSALAFLCESPADVDATFKTIVDAGFEPKKEPWNAFWGQRYAQVWDPDGNGVDLFAPLPDDGAGPS